MAKKQRTPKRTKRASGQPKAKGRRPAEKPSPTPPPDVAAPDVFIDDNENLPQPPAFMVVGIGASAGGLEACSALLRAIPGNIGMAFVIVQHLTPTHESFLTQLLGGNTSMPVVQVSDGIRLEPNHVYVIPPAAHMGVMQGRLHLVPRPEDRTQHAPIDVFFHALAEYAQSRAIGIILSGFGSDGAIGIREIKDAGGITIAQEPHTAKTDGMPRAAINTGMIDLVLSPDEIAQELVRISSHPLVKAEPAKPAPLGLEPADAQLNQLFQLLRNASGVDFAHYKLPTIKRRLQRRLVLHKLSSVDDYLRFVKENPTEVLALYQDLLIHVTRFFRHPESYDVLREKALPALMHDRPADVPIRVWIPGCATGEEAYSIAILIHEFLADQHAGVPVQVFGTDVSEAAVERARAGLFPESIAVDVSPERLRRFFTRVDGGYRISKNIRDLCIFARQDLTRDPPFSKLDLILCRNVLIYLGALLQKRLMTVFHYALKPTGFLMLGSAETVGASSDLFAIVDKRAKLYAKKMPMIGRSELDFPSVDFASHRPSSHKPPVIDAKPGSVQAEASQILLTRYAPAAVVVDAEMVIVQFRGQTGKFLESPPGEPTLNVLKMAREGLLYGLRTALHEARKTARTVRRTNLRVRTNGHEIDANIEVVPMSGQGLHRHYLVLFEDATVHRAASTRRNASQKQAKASAAAPAGEKAYVRQLRQELAASREYLQSIIQDLEAANEELQSANEEILSANEELQSTNEELDTAKEELQSTNEELNTVNEELQGRNEELSRVNSDLINLLANVQIAIVMVSSDLRVRRFTPMAEKLLNLIPTDVGRPIGDIKPNFVGLRLETLIAEAIDSVRITEQDVEDVNGRWYSLRIRPSKSADSRIDGAVIALFEIQGPRAQAQQAEVEFTAALAEAVMGVFDKPLLALDRQLRIQNANMVFCRVFGVQEEQVRGRRLTELADGRWDSPPLKDMLQKLLDGANEADGVIVDVPANGQRMRLVAHAAPGKDGSHPVFLVTFEELL